jgi:hypothetical protein
MREWVNEKTESRKVSSEAASNLDYTSAGGERSRVVQSAVRGMLNKLVESAPASAGVGRAPALAWAGLRLAFMVLLAAGVGIGLGDGDEFDDVGCSVAQQPGGTSHGAHSAKTRERTGGKLAGSEGGAAGSSGGGEPFGGKAYKGKAEMLKAETLKSEDAYEGKAEMLKTVAEEPSLSLAAKVLELLTALDPGNRLRKAPPIRVFLLRFRQNLSRAEIARACECSRTLVAERLRSIREKLPWQPRQLSELSGQVEAMEEAVSDSRARRIYRKGAVYGGEEEEEGEG